MPLPVKFTKSAVPERTQRVAAHAAKLKAKREPTAPVPAAAPKFSRSASPSEATKLEADGFKLVDPLRPGIRFKGSEEARARFAAKLKDVPLSAFRMPGGRVTIGAGT